MKRVAFQASYFLRR